MYYYTDIIILLPAPVYTLGANYKNNIRESYLTCKSILRDQSILVNTSKSILCDRVFANVCHIRLPQEDRQTLLVIN